MLEQMMENLFPTLFLTENKIKKLRIRISAYALGVDTNYECGEQLINELISIYDAANLDYLFNFRGLIQSHQSKWREAEVSFKKAIILKPNNPVYLMNMVALQNKRGHKQEAIDWYERAVSTSGYPHASQFFATHFFLNANEYKRAWECVESFEPSYVQTYKRQQQEAVVSDEVQIFVASILDSVPLWRGETLQEKNILLHSNPATDGLGDVILWLRFVSKVAALGANVILAIPPSLRNLAAQLPVIIYTEELTNLQLDYHSPVIFLPWRFDTQIDTIPTKPYLNPEKDLVTQWQQRFARFSGIKVGLVWRSADDDTRTIEPRNIAQLLSVSGVSFFSLQVHEKAASDLQVLKKQGEIIDVAADLTDFNQTAAAIAALDLMITVDTSVANLCGAMGRSDWVMLGLYEDFRWPAWFPTIRLFNQLVYRRWKPVMDEVIEQLNIKVKGIIHES